MPVIEEIDDDEIDSKHFSLEEFDPHNPFSRDMPVEEGAPVQLRPAAANESSSRPSSSAASSAGAGAGSRGGDESYVPPSMPPAGNANYGEDIPEHVKQWGIIYPCYFDKTRSVSQGRRVPFEQAVLNPLAVLISEACLSLGYESALELTKQHPKDWANPGRVRVNLPKNKSKREIYKDISKFLKSRPVNSQSARESMYKRLAQFDSLQPLATPRNMRFPKILPGVSPVLSARKTIDESLKMGGNDMAKMMGMG